MNLEILVKAMNALELVRQTNRMAAIMSPDQMVAFFDGYHELKLALNRILREQGVEVKA